MDELPNTHSRIFPYLLIILVCNLADWALTIDAVNAGWARELNPVGSWMLAHGAVGSLALKMGVVVPALAALLLTSSRRMVYFAAVSLAWVYVMLVVWHCYGRLPVG